MWPEKDLNDWDSGDYSELTDTADPNADGWDAPILFTFTLADTYDDTRLADALLDAGMGVRS